MRKRFPVPRGSKFSGMTTLHRGGQQAAPPSPAHLGPARQQVQRLPPDQEQRPAPTRGRVLPSWLRKRARTSFWKAVAGSIFLMKKKGVVTHLNGFPT